MPKAEIGSTKHLNNKMKSKGLQRLRWYCQVCEKQCRDENGFKMHSQSESHVRQMLLVGENSKKFISNFSNDFQRDFLQLLRTSHGEKKVHMNHFYQEYIHNKEHVHMNATRWPSLTEFAKHLGREGLCRVEENEKGLHISWIDNSPENLRRQDAIRKKERQDKGDEEREQMLIREQVERANKEAREEEVPEDEERELKRAEGEKIKLSFGAKPTAAKQDVIASAAPNMEDGSNPDTTPAVSTRDEHVAEPMEMAANQIVDAPSEGTQISAKAPLKIGFSSKSKNVFAAAKKNALGGKKSIAIEQPKKMSEAERIMREEMERKNKRGPPSFGGPAQKKPRF